MKKLILLTALFACMTAKAQVKIDSSDFRIINYWDLVFSDWDSAGFNGSIHFRVSDSTIEFKGFKDTLSALWSMYANVTYGNKIQDSMRRAKQELISAGVAWCNTVSDYFKASKAWRSYAALLRKNGYVIKKLK